MKNTWMMAISIALTLSACTNVSFTPAAEQLDQQSAKSPGPADPVAPVVPAPPITPDPKVTDSFTFNDESRGSKVDVLFVVDNSESMLDEQNKLSVALSSFITSLSAIDWQIGVTTTDVSNGPYGVKGSLIPLAGLGSQKILNKNTPNYESAFAKTVVRDELKNCTVECPSSDERPLEATLLAIAKKDTDNVGFFRTGADTAIVILSDEDERSNGTGALSPVDLINGFRQAFGEAKGLTGFGIVIQPGDSNCYNSQVLNAGKYANVISLFTQLTLGETGSICAPDYGPALSSIGKRVKEAIRSMSLSNNPVDGTLEVTITPQDPSLTWTIEGQTLTFNKVPAKGTRVDVKYVQKP